MATSSFHPGTSAPANADLSTKQFYFVNLNSSGKVALAADATKPLHILQNKPAAADEAAALSLPGGLEKLLVDGSGTAIAVGDCLTANASGKGIKTTTAGDFVGAIAKEASSANGDIIKVEPTNFRY